MEHCTSKSGDEKEIPAFGADPIEVRMRNRIREPIQAIVEEELETALGARKSARVGDLADEDIRDVFMDGWYPKSAASWTEVVANLAARHLARPILAVIDGHPGLPNALRSHGPGIAIQRCTAPTLRNLQAKAPARLREELTEDYRRMTSGDTVAAIDQARARFTKKWQLRCPAVVESLKEAVMPAEDAVTFSTT